MPVCPRYRGCALFTQFTMPSSVRVWQATYCEADHRRCERFKLVLEARPVPPDLLPNGRKLEPALQRSRPVPPLGGRLVEG